MNERGKALDNLEIAFETGDGWLVWAGVEPVFDCLRDDERFTRLLEQTNNPLFFESKTVSSETALAKIVVLPFKMLGLGEGVRRDRESLCVGLADALVARLSNSKQFIVRPTSAVLEFVNRDFDSFRVGKDLNADFVLDGYLQMHGERLGGSIQLLNVAEQTIVWQSVSTKKNADVSKLEDEIARRTIESLVARLPNAKPAKTVKNKFDNPAAVETKVEPRNKQKTLDPIAKQSKTANADAIIDAPERTANARTNAAAATRKHKSWTVAAAVVVWRARDFALELRNEKYARTSVRDF